jgi:fructoselysine 6-kinase
LGHQSALIGAVGTDEHGDNLIKLMNSKSVDVSHTYQVEGKTASNELIIDETGERFGKEGAWNDGVYGTFKLDEKDWDYIKDFDIWATHVNSPSYENALKNKTDRNFMSVDFLHLRDYKLLAKSADSIDIAFFGGTPDMINELEKLAKELDCLLVLTLGADGSVAFSGTKRYKQEALPIEKVVDTTGCGDAFQVGFTSMYIKTKDIQKALHEGAKLGRINAVHYGGARWGNNNN